MGSSTWQDIKGLLGSVNGRRARQASAFQSTHLYNRVLSVAISQLLDFITAVTGVSGRGLTTQYVGSVPMWNTEGRWH